MADKTQDNAADETQKVIQVAGSITVGELAELLESAERDDACTALVIDAAGSVFSAGGDVAAMAGSVDDGLD